MKEEEIISLITKSINTIITSLFNSIDNNIYNNLDGISFINPEIINNSSFSKLLGNNEKTGLIIISNTIILGLCIYYIVRYYFNNILEQPVEKPTQFIFKLLIIMFFINFSYFIIEQIININYLISISIKATSSSILNTDVSFSNLITLINKKIIMDNDINLLSYNGVLKCSLSIGLLFLLFSYSIRYILIQVLILVTPLVFLTLINSSSSWIFKSWCKALFLMLIIQIFIPIILTIIFLIDSTNEVLLLSGIFVLSKINTYIKEIFGGIGLEFSTNINSLITSLKR